MKYCPYCNEHLTIVNGRECVTVGTPDNDDCEYIDHDKWCNKNGLPDEDRPMRIRPIGAYNPNIRS
jgi:hypothetical protein